MESLQSLNFQCCFSDEKGNKLLNKFKSLEKSFSEISLHRETPKTSSDFQLNTDISLPGSTLIDTTAEVEKVTFLNSKMEENTENLTNPTVKGRKEGVEIDSSIQPQTLLDFYNQTRGKFSDKIMNTKDSSSKLNSQLYVDEEIVYDNREDGSDNGDQIINENASSNSVDTDDDDEEDEEEEDEEDEDEWENDDDTGYVLVPISEEEFLELEEEYMEYYERDEEEEEDEEEEDDYDDDDDDDDLNYKMDKNDEDNEGNGRKDQGLEDGEIELERNININNNDDDDDDDIEEAIKVLNFHGNFSLKDAFEVEKDNNNNSFNEKEKTTKDSNVSISKQTDGDLSFLENKSFERELSYSDTVDKFLSSFPVTPESTKELKEKSTEMGGEETEESIIQVIEQVNENHVEQTFSDDSNEEEQDNNGILAQGEFSSSHFFSGPDGVQYCMFDLKVIFEPFRTGFEESKHFNARKGDIIAGRYQVSDMLGQAAFSSAIQCYDLMAENKVDDWVCLKIIKNNKDFFDQSLDEIKLLQYINSEGDPEKNHVLRLLDYFYYKEHLFIVSELLRENLYDFGKYIRDNNAEPYFTMQRLKKITKQVLEALKYIHSLRLIHCDLKPENIVIKSYSRCEVKLIDFGSSCYITDHLSTYIQSRSYRAPEVILGVPYDYKIDVWSYGAVLAELLTGYVLFQNDSIPTMLARITGILGSFPEHVLRAGKETSSFFTLGNIVYDRIGPHSTLGPGSGNGQKKYGWDRQKPIEQDEKLILIYPKKTSLGARLHLNGYPDGSDEDMLLDFIRFLLDLDPNQRPTASDALCHPWLENADNVDVFYAPS